MLINPNTGEEYINVPVKVAAEYLKFSYNSIYEGLKQGVLPFGLAVQGKGGKWSFLIPCERLKAYANGKL